jgi:hypothetical protein
MYYEVSSSNPPDLSVPAEGAYAWHLEVIVVAVGIDPVSREYETGPVADSASIIIIIIIIIIMGSLHPKKTKYCFIARIFIFH